MRVAVLDPRGRLTGTREVDKPKRGDIDAGDLPADGSYKWIGTTFVPVGFGFGKPKPPGVDRDRAVFLLIRALTEGRPIPQECRDWCNWWERHHERKGEGR
jgi:hypothetical protein